jgi:hypothetical protein
MQLVNQICIHCRERIVRENDARFCPKCGGAVHLACSKRALSASPSGCCRACGAPAAPKEQPKRPQHDPPSATAAKGYHVTLLGVALMICGILGSIIFSGAGLNGPLLAAVGAIFGGTVLVVVGFIYSTRR